MSALRCVFAKFFPSGLYFIFVIPIIVVHTLASFSPATKAYDCPRPLSTAYVTKDEPAYRFEK